MSDLFTSIHIKPPKRNWFKKGLSHSVKTTCNQGEIIPIMMQDVLPNDRFKVSIQNLIRLAPMIAPAYSEISVQFHFFFVPNRIIWSKWEDFITQSHNGKMLADDELPQPPTFHFAGQSLVNATSNNLYINITDPSNGIKGLMQAPLALNSLADNLGFQTIPGDSDPTESGWRQGFYDLDQLPFRAYYKVWYDYFRDENLQSDVLDPADIQDMSGPHNVGNTPSGDSFHLYLMQLKHRAWKKDYFTSALPFAQKGDDVLIPGTTSFSNGNVNVSVQDNSKYGPGTSLPTGSGFNNAVFEGPGNETQALKGYFTYNGTSNNAVEMLHNHNASFNTSQLNQFLSTASEGTIRELRRAMAAQKYLERKATGGTRYIEQNLSFFGARSSDGRLQRPQFLGGYKQPVVISQLLQTSESTQQSPLGTPAGNAVSAGSDFIFDRTFEEYGWIVGLMSIVPKADYLNGIPRKFLRKDVYDYYWPQFAHIGEQPIMNQELYFSPQNTNNGLNEQTFGYTPRYAEYRYNPNRISGDFKGSLKFWTLGRDFTDVPRLNDSFITCNPSNRIFAVEDVDFKHFWCDLYLNVEALRPIPKYAESL